MNLHQMNDRGIEQFWHYLTALRQNRTAPPPPELADDPRFTELVEPVVQVEQRAFPTKYDAGVFLKRILSPIHVSRIRSDVGIWSWLAYWFFDQLCPTNGNGQRFPKEIVKYIPRPSDHRRGPDKHLLFFPWKMCYLHGEAARCFLGDEIGGDRRAQREWTGYNLNVSTHLIELASRLYGDEDRCSLKRGATGTRSGSLRRFVQVLKQLEVTYAIHGMSTDQLQALLPSREFSRWLA